MAAYKLLVCEDDPNLGQILKEYLDLKGFETTLCQDGEEGMAAYRKNSYDCCILDVMMPKKDGFTMAKEIRSIDQETPLIFLTARSMKQDTIEGFKIGADDYITKPFSMEELLLRLKAIFKRTVDKKDAKGRNTFKVGNFTFDADQRVLKIDSSEYKLTSKESQLLRLFCLNVNETLSRSDALKMIWEDDSYFNARSMDVYIAKLRKILKADESVKIITVHGQGFKLIEIS